MKKYLFILLALAVSFSACHRKPAQQQEQQEQMTNDQMVNDQMVNYINITALTPEGDELSLSDLVGQTEYVLLDFWASWCGPCRRFVPVLKEIYAGLPEGKLQILSCSVDQEEGAWKKALEEELMPWPQIREDETHLCADLYNVQFIPHTVLFDKEGNIVGVNLDEAQIEQILFAD